jgi:CheY-like chemotaxis protein
MGIKILLVEDDANFRAVFATALELQGYSVRQAASGQRALEMMRSERPDIIISDLEMSGLDGRSLCHRVRGDSELATIPFVILSAFVESDGRNSPADLPADRCLSKQIPISQVIQFIKELLDPSREGGVAAS